MTTLTCTTSVPVFFKQLLNSLSAVLTKAEAYAAEKKFMHLDRAVKSLESAHSDINNNLLESVSSILRN